MAKRSDLTLALFFTRGVSLRAWDQVGMFEREVALYRRLQDCGTKVGFVTYGDARDLQYAERIPGIRILCNRWQIPQRRYERWIPWLHALWLSRADVVKTNQTHGAEVALRAARRWSKPLIARCGYIWSLFASWKEGAYSDAAQRARVQEAEVFRAAQRVAVTTEEMKHYIIEQYGIPSDRVRVIPNYVLTELFRPDPDGGHQQGRLCFVGRLESQKNLFALLEAVRGLEVELEIIGDGPQRKALEEEAGKKGIKAFFLGNLPHSELPRRFNSAEIVVLPSLYEGHPKSLIEAMACGRPVVASDAPGIREIVSHRETGYLSAPTPGGIRAALEEVLGNATLRERMGRAARAFVLERFTLEQAVKAEVELLGELVK